MKNTLKRTFIVLFVTLLISLALLALAQTIWAQDMRGSLRGPEDGQAVLVRRADSAERLESLDRVPMGNAEVLDLLGVLKQKTQI